MPNKDLWGLMGPHPGQNAARIFNSVEAQPQVAEGL